MTTSFNLLLMMWLPCVGNGFTLLSLLGCEAWEGNMDKHQVYGGKEVKRIVLVRNFEQPISSRELTIVQDLEDKNGSDIHRKKWVRTSKSSKGKHTKKFTNSKLFFPDISRQGSECFWSCLRAVYIWLAKIPVGSGWICFGFLKIYFIISCLTPTMWLVHNDGFIFLINVYKYIIFTKHASSVQ